MPLVERLPELTPDHRVVYELSELQLPTLSRGTTVAVYTNVTSDHLDRHGTLEAYRRVKRRLAELVDPAGALVLNAEDPVVAGYADLGTAPVVRYRRDDPPAGGVGVVDGWIVADGVERLALAGWRVVDRPGRTDHAGRRARHPGRPQRLERAGGDRGGPALRDRAGGDPRGGGRVHRGRASPGAGRPRRRRPLRQRLAGHPARRGHRRAARLRRAGRPHRRRARQGRRPVGTRPGRRRAGRRGRAHRRERAGARAPLPRGGPRPCRARRVARRRGGPGRRARARGPGGRRHGAGPATVLLSPAAASFDMFADYAARGRAFKAAVADLVASRARRDR